MKLFLAALFAAVLMTLPTVTFAQEDVTPPTLLDVSFEPETIDTSKGPQTITVTVHVTDDLSGVKHVALHFRKPDTTQQAQVEYREDEGWSEIVEGDALDGKHVATMTLPQYAAYGEWEMYGVSLSDNVGNSIFHSKPDSEEGTEGRGIDSDEWPSLFNGFVFAVGQANTPQEPEQPANSLFLPSLAN